jgi:hypothetical protein
MVNHCTLQVEIIPSSTTFPHHGTRKRVKEANNIKANFFIRNNKKYK